MVPLDPIKELKAKKEWLLKEQERLITSFKNDYPELYDWFSLNNIDLKDLRMYSASIAAALVVGLSVGELEPANTSEVLPPVPVEVITQQELTGLQEEEKAELVNKRYGNLIDRVAKRYDLDPKLIFATIMVESTGDAFAYRYEPSIGDASFGLGQILYGTAVSIGFEGNYDELYKPEVNIDLIGRYHRRNLDAYGDLTASELAQAYNSGSPYSYAIPGHVNKFATWYETAERLGV